MRVILKSMAMLVTPRPSAPMSRAGVPTSSIYVADETKVSFSLCQTVKYISWHITRISLYDFFFTSAVGTALVPNFSFSLCTTMLFNSPLAFRTCTVSMSDHEHEADQLEDG